MKTLSVLMPVYNESRTLRTIVGKVLDAPVDLEIELICVDDGSSDGSLESWLRRQDHSRPAGKHGKGQPRRRCLGLLRRVSVHRGVLWTKSVLWHCQCAFDGTTSISPWRTTRVSLRSKGLPDLPTPALVFTKSRSAITAGPTQKASTTGGTGLKPSQVSLHRYQGDGHDMLILVRAHEWPHVYGSTSVGELLMQSGRICSGFPASRSLGPFRWRHRQIPRVQPQCARALGKT